VLDGGINLINHRLSLVLVLDTSRKYNDYFLVGLDCSAKWLPP
jgi:hypothetical protein